MEPWHSADSGNRKPGVNPQPASQASRNPRDMSVRYDVYHRWSTTRTNTSVGCCPRRATKNHQRKCLNPDEEPNLTPRRNDATISAFVASLRRCVRSALSASETRSWPLVALRGSSAFTQFRSPRMSRISRTVQDVVHPSPCLDPSRLLEKISLPSSLRRSVALSLRLCA